LLNLLHSPNPYTPQAQSGWSKSVTSFGEKASFETRMEEYILGESCIKNSRDMTDKKGTKHRCTAFVAQHLHAGQAAAASHVCAK